MAIGNVYKNATITIDGDEFADALTRGRLVPDVNVQVLRTLVPTGTIVDTDSAVWTFEVTSVQDFAASGVAKTLHDAWVAGTDIDIVLQPVAGTGQRKATFSVKPLPLPFGGEQGQWMLAELEYNVIGQPVFGTSS